MKQETGGGGGRVCPDDGVAGIHGGKGVGGDEEYIIGNVGDDCGSGGGGSTGNCS